MADYTQGYEVMSMQPIQLNLVLKNALSAQNIRVTIPTTVTVAISQEPLIMQNAANRLLGADDDVKESLISDIVYGQMRLVIASMTIEELNLEAEAEGTKKKLLAEGKKASLMAVAKTETGNGNGSGSCS